MKMVDRLSNLIGIFNAPGLDFSGNRAEMETAALETRREKTRLIK